MQDPIDASTHASRRKPWNKGKLIGAKPASQTEARLVDPYQAANRRTNTRLGHVQSSHR
jgi:hypothetical protein